MSHLSSELANNIFQILLNVYSHFCLPNDVFTLKIMSDEFHYGNCAAANDKNVIN